MVLRKGVLAIAIASTAVPLCAATRSTVSISAPVIQVDALQPGASAPGYSSGGHRVDDFDQYLSPAPVPSETGGNASITANDDFAVGGRTDGPGSHFIVVGDRYAPSFTFTATANSRVTIEAAYRLESAVVGEPLDLDNPARAHASFELMVVAFNNFAVGADGSLSYDLLAIETDTAALQTVHDGSMGTESQLDEGTLRVTFENRSGHDAVFAFRGEMVAWGVSPTSPAPEPASVALMLSGLGVVGWVASRRRRTQAGG